jgi:hypothetical protein
MGGVEADARSLPERHSMRLTLILLLVAIWPASAAMAAASAPDLAVGQVWSIRGPDLGAARLTICRIEPFPGGHIAVSVSVTGVPAGHGAISVAQLPFDAATLAASLNRLIATDQPAPSGFAAGYQEWRNDRGGLFVQPVDVVLALILSRLPAPVGHAPAPPQGGAAPTGATSQTT